MAAEEESCSDWTAPSTASGPSFLHKFSVHLASALLGSDNVLNRVESAMTGNRKRRHQDHSSSIRLYWRSPLLVEVDGYVLAPVDDSNGDQQKRKEEDGSHQWRLVFVDMTFDFSVGSGSSRPPNDDDNRKTQQQHHHQPYITVTMGSLVQSMANKNGIYVKGKPLNMASIRNHVNQMDIDLDLDNPVPLAISMADALVTLSTNLKAKERGKPLIIVTDNNKIDTDDNGGRHHYNKSLKVSVPLYCSGLCETAYWQIENDKVTSNLDTDTMIMLFNNIVGGSCYSAEDLADKKIQKDSKESSAAVLESLQKWCLQVATPIPMQGGLAKSSLNGDRNPLDDANQGEMVEGVAIAKPNPSKHASLLSQSPSICTSNQSKGQTITNPALVMERTQHQHNKQSLNAGVNPTSTTSSTCDKSSLVDDDDSGAKPLVKPNAVRTMPDKYVIVDRAATNKRRKRGKLTYSKMK